jgi:hypothetical protein
MSPFGQQGEAGWWRQQAFSAFEIIFLLRGERSCNSVVNHKIYIVS